MNGMRKKCENLHFWAFWAKIANFGQFLAKMGKTEIFFKKTLGTFFSSLQALTNCKVSEKSNERFSSNSVTDGRTYGRTDVNPQVSNEFVERPKNQGNPICGFRKTSLRTDERTDVNPQVSNDLVRNKLLMIAVIILLTLLQ